MIQVNITDFRNNMKKYSRIAKEQDLEILNRGEVVFIVKSPGSNKLEALHSLMGAVISDVPYEEILKERLREL